MKSFEALVLSELYVYQLYHPLPEFANNAIKPGTRATVIKMRACSLGV
jgi:hypothetical protein